MSMEDELKEMEEALENPVGPEDLDKSNKNEEGSEPTDEPKDESVEEQDESDEPEPSDNQEDSEEVLEEPESSELDQSEPESPEDPRDAKIRELEEKIAKLESLTRPAESEPSEPSEPETTTTDEEIPTEDFLGDLDIDDVVSDPKALNQLLNNVHRKALERARLELKQSSENVVRSIPDIVRNVTMLTTRLKKISDDFYNENKDLVPWKKTVGAVMEELISENPDKTYKELLPQVASEVRRRVGLYREATRQDGPPSPPPRRKGRAKQTTKPDTNPLLEEFEAMDRALGID